MPSLAKTRSKQPQLAATDEVHEAVVHEVAMLEVDEEVKISEVEVSVVASEVDHNEAEGPQPREDEATSPEQDVAEEGRRQLKTVTSGCI